MKSKKIILAVLLILALLLANVPTFAVSSIGHEVKTVQISSGSKKVNVVTVDLRDKNLVLEVVKSQNIVGGAEPFADIIKRTDALAAINGNFFDAYKTLEPYGSIMQNGKLIYLEGTNTSFSVLKDNVVHMDHYSMSLCGYLDGKRENAWNNYRQAMDFNLFSVWYCNTMPHDSTGVYLFTPERSKSIPVNGGHGIYVVNNTVEKVVKNPTELCIPANGYIIYYAPYAADDAYVRDRFRAGRTVELELAYKTSSERPMAKLINPIAPTEIKLPPSEIKTPKEGEKENSKSKKEKEETKKEKDKKEEDKKEEDKKETDKKETPKAPLKPRDIFEPGAVQQLISAGPFLVKNGHIVVDAEAEGFKEAKITTNRAQRSALGVTKDQKLLLVTASSIDVKDLAMAMKELGCIYAMNLDGGASSGLFANGKMITTPGRALNTVLVVKKKP